MRQILFLDFVGKSHAQKPNKSLIKWANKTGVQNFCAYQQFVSTYYFILYYLFILFPYYFFQYSFLPSPPPLLEYAAALDQEGIINSLTSLPPTSDESLATNEPLYWPPRFHRRICCFAWYHLRWSPTFTPTLAIRHPRCHHLWPPIKAYKMSPLIIYSDLSVPTNVSMSVAPPYYLNPRLDHPSTLWVVGKYGYVYNEYLEL